MNFHAKSVQCSRKNIDLRNRRLGFVLILPLSSLDNQMTFWNLSFSFVKVGLYYYLPHRVVVIKWNNMSKNQQRLALNKNWLMLYMSSQRKNCHRSWVAGFKTQARTKGTLHKSEKYSKFTFFFFFLFYIY